MGFQNVKIRKPDTNKPNQIVC